MMIVNTVEQLVDIAWLLIVFYECHYQYRSNKHHHHYYQLSILGDHDYESSITPHHDNHHTKYITVAYDMAGETSALLLLLLLLHSKVICMVFSLTLLKSSLVFCLGLLQFVRYHHHRQLSYHHRRLCLYI